MAERQIGIVLHHLRAWRLRALLKQDELAARAQIARATVVRAERGGAISIDNVKALAEALGITTDQLRFEQPMES